MAIISRIIFASTLLAAGAALAQPPSYTEAQPVYTPTVVKVPKSPLATTERWGGGVRLTGLSGIGALPGVNYGAEVAGHLRRDEYFVELALGRWKPRDTYLVSEMPTRVELGLDLWTVRAGWESMKMPLRGWLLAEVGELASARRMAGVVTRMMTGSTPDDRQWRALGGGFGVAWPMTNQARLVGTMELAIPVNREKLMLDRGEAYEPDPLAARYSIGLEVGWR
jgi:hypothetical protein